MDSSIYTHIKLVEGVVKVGSLPTLCAPDDNFFAQLCSYAIAYGTVCYEALIAADTSTPRGYSRPLCPDCKQIMERTLSQSQAPSGDATTQEAASYGY